MLGTKTAKISRTSTSPALLILAILAGFLTFDYEMLGALKVMFAEAGQTN